jgi:hypothetical protein
MSVIRFKLVLMAALGAACLSASAQQTMVFSKPADVNADKANSFMDNSSKHMNAGDYKAPHQLLNIEPDLPLPRPSYSPGWDSSAQDALNRRKNWTLLTPEQILGIKTPEEVLGVKSRDGKEKLSLEEQFLLRERNTTLGAATNGGAANLFMRDDSNPFLNKNDRQSPLGSSPYSRQDQIAQQDPAGSLRQLFNTANIPKISPEEQQRQNSIWTSGFYQPTQPKVTPEQTAAMERFRALMEPSSPPDRVAAPASYTPRAPARESYFQTQSKVNPVGSAYNSLESDITRPTGVAPLPGITGPVKKPETKRPDWKAQLPPWMNNGPQPHNNNW